MFILICVLVCYRCNNIITVMGAMPEMFNNVSHIEAIAQSFCTFGGATSGLFQLHAI